MYRTEHDMSGFSESALDERDKLTETFISKCQELQNRLNQSSQGEPLRFDFIDPSSGKAFLKPGSSMFLETDEVAQIFPSLSILDLGCCKALDHPKFSTYCMCCSIFTDAQTKLLIEALS